MDMRTDTQCKTFGWIISIQIHPDVSNDVLFGPSVYEPTNLVKY